MSRRQDEILAFIVKYNSDKGFSPSIREIASAVGLSSSSTVAGHIDRLIAKGLVKKEPYAARTLKVIDPMG